MSDNVFWVSLWAILLTAAVTFGTLLQYNYCTHIQRMAELGYQEETLVGIAMPVWRKVVAPVEPATCTETQTVLQ